MATDPNPDAYRLHPLYLEIQKRFDAMKPRIRLLDHMSEVIDMGRTHSEGITFVPKDHQVLARQLTDAMTGGRPAFHEDDKRVTLYAVAASATKGRGFREIGKPSLHFQIAADACNVHVDEVGFVAEGPLGDIVFTPDLLRHIIDELAWRSKVRPQVAKILPEFAVKLLDHTYIVAPSSENRYVPRVGVGVGVDLPKDAQLRFEVTCGNRGCSDASYSVMFTVPL